MDDLIGPGALVTLEWDRGHESIEAIVRARSDTGIVVTELHDLEPRQGLKWIRHDEVLLLESLPPDGAPSRLADVQGTRAMRADEQLTDLPVLIAAMQDAGLLIAVYDRVAGSSECSVGTVSDLGPERFVIRTVDTDARFDGDTPEFELDDVLSVEWGTTYLDAITALLRAEGALP